MNRPPLFWSQPMHSMALFLKLQAGNPLDIGEVKRPTHSLKIKLSDDKRHEYFIFYFIILYIQPWWNEIVSTEVVGLLWWVNTFQISWELDASDDLVIASSSGYQRQQFYGCNAVPSLSFPTCNTYRRVVGSAPETAKNFLFKIITNHLEKKAEWSIELI